MGKEKSKVKVEASSIISKKDSMKTKLGFVMIILVTIPLLIAIVVSYNSSTNKAIADAQDSLEWQARYLEDVVSKIIDKNVAAMKTLAASPATITYVEQDPNNKTIPDSAMLDQMLIIDDYLDDGNSTIITALNGQQLIRTAGDCVNIADREYFQMIISGNCPIYVSDVLVSKTNNSRIIIITVPVYDDNTGEIIGSVQRDYNMDDLHDILAAEADDAFVVDRTGAIAAHSILEIEPDQILDVSGDQFYTSEDMEGFYESINHETSEMSYVAFVKEPNTNFIIAVGEPKSEVLSAARQSATLIAIIGIIMLIISTIISMITARVFTEPLKEISNSLKDLSNGRFTKVTKNSKRKDEFGAISRDTNSVIERLEDIVGNIKVSSEQVGHSANELSEMSSSISTTADDVSNAVGEISTGASQQAEEIQTAAESTGKIGDAVDSVKNSSSDLSNIAQKMKEASEISSKSLESLQDSSVEMTEKIDEISNAISRTEEAVNSISEKVEGISGIATQTNLLSLNASIEAARAGDAGKGFAVVAEEIRKLADDSDTMASEIKVEMERLLEEARAAVEAAKDVKEGNFEQQEALGETINSINGMLDDINSTVDGVSLITKGADICDESKNAVIDMMSALSAISEENAASSEETEASMEQLANTVGTLAESAESLKAIADKLNEEMKFFNEE